MMHLLSDVRDSLTSGNKPNRGSKESDHGRRGCTPDVRSPLKERAAVVLRYQMAKVIKIRDVVTEIETTRTKQSVIPVIVRVI
jgi:hypothetical protein